MSSRCLPVSRFLCRQRFQTQASSVSSALQEMKLQGTTIAIAQDTAFSFIYPANIDVLVDMGASLVYFSPIKGESLPDCDAVYLPGGYPELFMEALASNGQLQQQIRAHVLQDKPLLAECGGMLYLNRTLKMEAECVNMSGVLDADSVMQPSLVALGLVAGELQENEWMRGIPFTTQPPSQTRQFCVSPFHRAGKNSIRLETSPDDCLLYSLVFPVKPRADRRYFSG
ncbi:hypothetical protein P4S72_00775 [Vibrio sp. PP-XX7]